MYALVLQAVDDGLTVKEIAVDIPHDMAAFVVYAMLGIFVFFTWFASKPSVVARYGAKYDPIGPQSDAIPDSETVSGEANLVDSSPSARTHVSPAPRKPAVRRRKDPARIAWIG
jgi:hypothetical protein